jgi:hypothetical protein
MGLSPVVRRKCKGLESAAKSMVSISSLITTASHAMLDAKSGPTSLPKMPHADLYHFVFTEISYFRFT